LKFKGISKKFSLLNNDQYNSIGLFWDEMSLMYGLENLQGLGYKWIDDTIYYAIGLKVGIINDYNACIDIPDIGWNIVVGETDNLKEIYDKIYKDGPLKYEIETFYENGKCEIKYYR
jgi:hypothetical protein